MSDPATPPQRVGAASFPITEPDSDSELPFRSSGVTVEQVPRKLTMYRVTEEELFTLRGIGPTLSLAFFGIMVGASFTVYTAMQGILDRDTRHDLNALYIGARVGVVFFALLAGIGYLRL